MQADLQRVSRIVWYEWAMFHDLELHLRKNSDEQQYLRNAHLEAFLIHARALEAFFYGESRKSRPHRNDVFAANFFIEISWDEIRPEHSKIFEKESFRDRIGSEIAHVSKARWVDAPNREKWRFHLIYRKLDPVRKTFRQNVNKDFLHDLWMRYPDPTLKPEIESKGVDVSSSGTGPGEL